MDIEVDIETKQLCLIYDEPNGNVFDHDFDSYWLIDDFTIQANYNSNQNNIRFILKSDEKTTVTYSIVYILYNMYDLLIDKINKGEREFNIEEHDILVRLVENIPTDIKINTRYSEKIDECKARKRNIKIDTVLK